MNKRRITIASISNLNRESITSKNIPENIYYLDTGNITKNTIKSLQYLEKKNDKYPSRAKRMVQDKTIIYSTVRPDQEHFGILSNPKSNLIVSTGFTTIDIIDKDVEPLYIYYSLTRSEITRYLHRIAENSVSSYPSINPDDIGNLINSSIFFDYKNLFQRLTRKYYGSNCRKVMLPVTFVVTKKMILE